MLPGYNHNLRHAGLLFHIQTEDNGLSNPYVVSHVFYGGNIVATRRQSYAKFVQIGNQEREDIVRSIMKEQHKELMKDLVEAKIQSVQEIIAKETGDAAPVQREKDENPFQRMRTSQSSVSPADSKVQSRVAPSSKVVNKQAAAPTLDTASSSEKTLDELILEFLEEEQKSK